MSVPAEQLQPRRAAQRRAVIRRASRDARLQIRRMDSDVRAELRALYLRARDRIEERIRDAAGGDNRIQISQLVTLRSQIESEIDLLASDRSGMLDARLNSAASVGVGPFAGEISGLVNQIADESVRFVRNFVGEDGLQLSDRFWRIDRSSRARITESIEQAIISGDSAQRAAREFLANGQAVPDDIARKIAASDAGAMTKVVGAELITDQGSALGRAQMVFRTEINRVHGEAYRAAALEVPGVIGMRFMLSANHPRPDICDMHASVNRYGLGPGVYPPDRSPWPAHPNTLSFEEPVFEDEISNEDRQGKQTRIEWLGAQSPRMQKSVLGAGEKVAALRSGILKEGQIATPWKILKKRYARQGIDVDELKRRLPPLDITPRPALDNLTPSGVAVSKALRIEDDVSLAQAVLESIDGVHGDGNLPEIPVINDNWDNALGYYDPRGPIGIQPNGPWKALTLTHEIGHFLDHRGAGSMRRFSSTHDERWAGWRSAIARSEAVKELNKARARARGGAGGRYLDYLLTLEELWARSYAQYITLRSGHPRLVSDLQRLRDRAGNSKGQYRQWADDDFEDIANAMDELMEDLGWRTTKSR